MSYKILFWVIMEFLIIKELQYYFRLNTLYNILHKCYSIIINKGHITMDMERSI